MHAIVGSGLFVLEVGVATCSVSPGDTSFCAVIKSAGFPWLNDRRRCRSLVDGVCLFLVLFLLVALSC